ncbi:MAG: hypothetical protein KGJ78_14605 [Alphaproteobacteria bacterium]|nr:hypothetical protein [Alphaproteobacteria bacterium]
MQISTANLQVASQQTAQNRPSAAAERPDFQPLSFKQTAPQAEAAAIPQPEKPAGPVRPGTLVDIKV